VLLVALADRGSTTTLANSNKAKALQSVLDNRGRAEGIDVHCLYYRPRQGINKTSTAKYACQLALSGVENFGFYYQGTPRGNCWTGDLFSVVNTSGVTVAGTQYAVDNGNATMTVQEYEQEYMTPSSLRNLETLSACLDT
jgi:hypothetical protein